MKNEKSLLTFERAVLGETTSHGDAVGLEMFAKQGLAAAAKETHATELRVVGNDPLAQLKLVDFGADSGNGANCFMAWIAMSMC